MSTGITLGPLEATILATVVITSIGFLIRTLYQRLHDRITETRKEFFDRVGEQNQRFDKLFDLLQRHIERETSERRR